MKSDDPKPMPTWMRVAFGALLALHVLISFQGIGEYFLLGHHGWAGSMRSTIARNYVRHGLVDTGLLPVRNVATVDDPSEFRVHFHHPPGLSLMVAASFAVFGEHEWAARLVPIAGAIASFLLLFVIVRLRYGPGAALLSVAVYALLPVQIEYGNHISYNNVIIPLTLGALYLLERLRHGEPERPWRYVAGIVSLMLIAGFVDWSAFFLAAFLGVDALVRKPRRPWVFVGLGVATAALLALLFWWLSDAAGGDGLMRLAKSRATRVTFEQLLARTSRRFVNFVGFVPVATTAGFLAAGLVRRRIDPLVVVFAGGTTVYFAVFKQAAWVHLFYILLFAPAFAVATGVGATKAYEWLAQRKVWVGQAFLVAWLGLFAGTILWSMPLLHTRTYKVNPEKRPRRGFPDDGKLHHVLLGKLLHEMTDEGDVVALNVETMRPSKHLRYYTSRRIRTTKRFTPPRCARVYVARAARVPRKVERELAREHALVRTMGFLVYDLSKPGPDVTTLEFVPQHERDFLHWYFVSAFYPPHELVPDPQSSAQYLRRLGLARDRRQSTNGGD